MTYGSRLFLFSGAALLALSLATPASAAPTGSYQQTCRNIEQHRGQVLTAECRTRDGSWLETRLDSSECSGDIANLNGRLVCNDRDNDRMSGNRHQNDDAYGSNPFGSQGYGDRHDNDRNGWGGQGTLSRGQLVHRMQRQGYYAGRDFRQMRNSSDLRATATWHGRRVVVRLNPRNGRVLSAHYN